MLLRVSHFFHAGEFTSGGEPLALYSSFCREPKGEPKNGIKKNVFFILLILLAHYSFFILHFAHF